MHEEIAVLSVLPVVHELEFAEASGCSAVLGEAFDDIADYSAVSGELTAGLSDDMH